MLTAVAALGLAAPATAGCGDGDCGPGDAPVTGLGVTASGVAATYGGFTSSPNNDCPPPEGGPTSLTIDGVQTDPAPPFPYHVTFCVPRPEAIDSGAVDLVDNQAVGAGREVQVVNLNAALPGNCQLAKNPPPAQITGTVEFTGYCGDGLDPAGYAITLSGTVAGTLSCPDGAGGTTDEPMTIELAGTVAVEATNLDL